MDADASEKIASFVARNHKKLSTINLRAPQFKWCRSICESDRRPEGNGFKLRYAAANEAGDKIALENLLRHPSKGGVSKFYVVGVDSRAGWIKLIRFIVVRDGDVNVEAVFISKSDKVACDRDGCDKKLGSDKFLGFGYRYEHPEDFPEGQEGADDHAFFHVQPIRMTHDKVELPSRPTWLPDNFPTFFMFAANRYEVVVYAIHSMVGVKPIEELYRDSGEWNGGFFMDRLMRLRGASREPFVPVVQN